MILAVQKTPLQEVVAVEAVMVRGRPQELYALVRWHTNTTTWEPVTGKHANISIQKLPMYRNFILRANRPDLPVDLPRCGNGPWYCVLCATSYNPDADDDQVERGVVVNPPRRRLRLNGCRSCLCWECYQGIMKSQRRTARRCIVCNREFEHPHRNWVEEAIPEELLKVWSDRLERELESDPDGEQRESKQQLVKDWKIFVERQTRLRASSPTVG